MGDQVRELTAGLDFDVDLTGANRFEKKFGDLVGQSEKFAGSFNKSFGVVNKTIGALAVVGASVAGVTKSYQKLTDVQASAREIKLQVGDDEFANIALSIDKTLEKTGDFVSQLDALEAFRFGQNIVNDSKFLLDNFEALVKASAVLKGEDIGSVMAEFSAFIEKGGGIGMFRRLGIFSTQQLETLSKAGADFSDTGIETRKKAVTPLFAKIMPSLNKNFADAQKENQMSMDRLSVSIDNLGLAIGTELSPAINQMANGLASTINSLANSVSEKGFLEASGDLIKGILLGTEEELLAKKTPIFNADKNISESGVADLFGMLVNFGRRVRSLTPKKYGLTSPNQNTTTDNTTNNTNNISVTVNGSGDPVAVGKTVVSEAQKIIDLNSRKLKPYHQGQK